MFGSSAFCDHDNSSQITGRLARLDYARDLVVIEWNFGNQNDVGAAGDTAVQCDPSGVAPHHFDNHDPPVTCRSGVHSIERIHHNIDSGIESERRCCRFEIVVDGLRDTDAIDAGLLQLLRRHHRPIAANDDQCSHMKLLQDFLGARNYIRRHNGPIAGAHFGDEMTPVGGADNCAAERHDSVDALPIENDVIARRKKPFESVAKTDDLPTEFFRSEHNSAQHRVQSRAITTTGQDSNPRFHFCNSAIRASF